MPRQVELSKFGRLVGHFRVDSGLSLKEICAASGANYYTVKDALCNDQKGLEAQKRVRAFIEEKYNELQKTG